ncbi:hypothetical protein B7463_g10468, partial [Scytalidium lignicola]
DGMAEPELTPAKAILLAAQLACKADLSTFRTLTSRHPKGLGIDIILRILLTHLPESLSSSVYVPFLQDLHSGNIEEDVKHPIDLLELGELSNAEAVRRVKRLHLLPLAWPNAPEDIPTDPFVLFLVHRALRIDENTGLITQVPELLAPFLHLSHFLRTWLISTILPLLRFSYEYYPHTGTILSISAFEDIDYRNGVSLLLSNTGKVSKSDGTGNTTVGRDLRGLIGPWMYGDTRAKRRKLGSTPMLDTQLVAQLTEPSLETQKLAGWEEVFRWIAGQATTSWQTSVEAIEQWDGPGDVDFGSYRDGTDWLDEEDQQHLEQRYARTALASAYLIREASVEALTGVQRILSRIANLLDFDSIPSLSASATLLPPASDLEGTGLLSTESASFLRNHLLEDENILTSSQPESIQLLHTLLLSAFLLTRQGVRCNVRRAGELALLQHEAEQNAEFVDLLAAIRNGPKGDDKYWVKTRNEILWLHGWGLEERFESAEDVYGKGVFGSLKKEFVEAEILKLFLANTRNTLAQSIYETSIEPPLPSDLLCTTVISAAMNAYDNATNANNTRGGVKKCLDILNAFRDTLEGSLTAEQLRHLVQVTHEIGQYRLVLKKGEPFTPVILRVHSDPISIIGRVLDQNPKAYTKINEFIRMGEEMVMAGLTVQDAKGHSTITPEEYPQQISIAEKRVVSMCIDAALAEDDFETAYSYVVTRLKSIAGEAQSRTPQSTHKGSGLSAHSPAKTLDDWSWRAALQAGKYKRVRGSVKPTHFGNATANLEIRHLEQRMDCLAHALRLAPKSTLQEILNVYRRCEEELESQIKSESDQEAAWDIKGDDQGMPGAFSSAQKDAIANSGSRAVEEAPLSLFDLSRASMARAQSGFSALSMLRRDDDGRKSKPGHSPSTSGSEPNTPSAGDRPRPIRKRDQLRNVAVGSLASGIGWLINAPPINTMDNDDDDSHYCISGESISNHNMAFSNLKRQLNMMGQLQNSDQDMVPVPSWRPTKKALLPKIGTTQKQTASPQSYFFISRVIKQYRGKLHELIQKAAFAENSSEVTDSNPVVLLAFDEQHAQDMATAIAPLTKSDIQIQVLSETGFRNYEVVQEVEKAVNQANHDGNEPTNIILHLKVPSAKKALSTGVTNNLHNKNPRHNRSRPLKVFRVFPNLPPEVRRLIWAFAAYHPRIVDITVSRSYSICKSSTPVPAILHTCTEARMVAKEIYSPMFQNSWMDSGVYVNLNVDTVKMGEIGVERICYSRDANLIRARNGIRFVHITFNRFCLRNMAKAAGMVISACPRGIFESVEMLTLHFHESDTSTLPTNLYGELEISHQDKHWKTLEMLQRLKVEMEMSYQRAKQAAAKGSPILAGVKIRSAASPYHTVQYSIA